MNRMATPSLDDVLHDRSRSPYTKPHFAHYLLSVHSLENLEFVLEVTQYIGYAEAGELAQHPNLWHSIRRVFVAEESAREINLPCEIRCKLAAEQPELCCVKRARQIIYDILHDQYNEFAKRALRWHDSEPDPVARDPAYHDTPQHQQHAVHSPMTSPPMRVLLPMSRTSPDLQLSLRRALDLSPVVPFSPQAERHIVPVIPRSGSMSYYEETIRSRTQQFSPSTDSDVAIFDEDAEIVDKRHNSTGSASLSRGLSIGSLVDSFKHNDMMNWRKAVRKFKMRRFLNEET